MAFIDTSKLPIVERLPGWRGRYFDSPSMTFAHYEFDAGSSIHEHSHPQEEVYRIIRRRTGTGHWRHYPTFRPWLCWSSAIQYSPCCNGHFKRQGDRRGLSFAEASLAPITPALEATPAL